MSHLDHDHDTERMITGWEREPPYVREWQYLVLEGNHYDVMRGVAAEHAATRGATVYLLPQPPENE